MEEDQNDKQKSKQTAKWERQKEEGNGDEAVPEECK
jgi:hypothetical protein